LFRGRIGGTGGGPTVRCGGNVTKTSGDGFMMGGRRRDRNWAGACLKHWVGQMSRWAGAMKNQEKGKWVA
jgi:hypothetical protein